MILTILSMLLFGGIHIYWLFGGVWAVKNVIPTKDNQDAALKIPTIATIIVALGLFSIALLYLLKSGIVSFPLPLILIQLATYTYWFIPTIFLLRAIGDFNYVGIFKKVKHTTFAKADTQIFIPLCLTIGMLGFLIQIL